MIYEEEEIMREQINEKVDEKRSYSRYVRVAAGMTCYLAAMILALYVGGWMMIFKPIEATIAAYAAGTLTIKGLAVTALKCILSTTAAGAIWCSGYILKQKFIGHPEY